MYVIYFEIHKRDGLTDGWRDNGRTRWRGVSMRMIASRQWIYSRALSNSQLCHMLKKFIFIFLFFLAVLGLLCCVWAFSSCGEWGPLFIAVRGPLNIAASLVAEHRLQTCRLSNCGSWA